LSFSQVDPNASRNPLERPRGTSSRAPSRQHLQRLPFGNPYLGGGPSNSRFPFASRLSIKTAHAPLFYSATDEFREEDHAEEHDREVADMYALQISRRDFAASRLSESSELDGEIDNDRDSRLGGGANRQSAKGRGIRSSWTGADTGTRGMENDDSGQPANTQPLSAPAEGDYLGKGKNQLVDVELNSTIHGNEQPLDHGADAAIDEDEDPQFLQLLRKPPTHKAHFYESGILARITDPMDAMGKPRPPSSDTESVRPLNLVPLAAPPRHDAFWATLFVLCVTSVLATFILIYLNTSAPKKHGSLGDTIYTTMHSSFYLLAVDTLVAVIIALLWLAILRSFVRTLVLIILVAVPVILFSFSVYPFISSYKGSWHGDSMQDKAMRWGSFGPAILGSLWTYMAFRGRRSFGRAIEILEFATRILAASPALVLVGFATLSGVVVWTWIWMLMFTRVFLVGHIATNKHIFVIDRGTWCVGVLFIITYLWTLGVISGIQRATTAATVSQWYFHRLVTPAPSSHQVVRASFNHAISSSIGTICLSTLLSLAIRLPLLVLPRQISRYVSFCLYSLVPTPIATVTNPLTLTYAAIHSQPLGISARGLSEMPFISSASPTTTLTLRAVSRINNGFDGNGVPSLVAYRLAKLLLHATRFVTSLAFGFGGWVSTARMLRVPGSTRTGSLYAYVIGMVAGTIGWAVLGAMEGVLGGILDAVVVCWGSEVGSRGNGQARYCREAGELLRDEDQDEIPV